MKSNKFVVLLFGLAMLLLAACGSNANAGGITPPNQPDKLKIVAHEITSEQPKTLNPASADKAQELYTMIYALPKVAPDRMCTMQAGPNYDLTFVQGDKTILSVNADRSGCGTVTLDKNDQRQPDKKFWELLNQAGV
jgi:hypothetical protein